MTPLSFEHFYAMAMIMFGFGIVGVLTRRNVLIVLMSIELLLNAVNIVFVTASAQHGNFDGQIMTFFVMTVAACEAAVGLAMVIAIYRRWGTIETQNFRILRG